jgi:hypothetical protein
MAFAHTIQAALASALLGIVSLTVTSATGETATNLNSSKSNIYRPIANTTDAAACRLVRGTIVVRQKKQICVDPKLPRGWSQKQLPSCETCNTLCPGVCFMHVEGGCICFYDSLRTGG